jgi:DNA topoisomerase II
MSTKQQTKSSLGKSITETYQKKTQLEHIKTLPETYIGSIEKNDALVWTIQHAPSISPQATSSTSASTSTETISMEKEYTMSLETVQFCPGFYKLFDEILVNASDHYQRIRVRKEQEPSTTLVPVTKISVDIDPSTGWIHVLNDGEGIDVVEHEEHHTWVPTMIFGELLTSTNYDQEEEKVTGGKNGYGAKLTNIFSHEFIVETVDAKRKKKFIQVFKNGMEIRETPIITSFSGKPYTKISYLPNYAFFKMAGMDPGLFYFLKKRVLDTAACTDKSVSVFFNQEKVEIKEFKQYMDCYLGPKAQKDRFHTIVSDRWEVGVALSNDGFRHVSFVNGINTYQGGKHVEYISNQITRKIQDLVATKGYKRKKMELKAQHIKDHLWIFVRCLIVNPSFSSQTKELLTTPITKFGSKCELTDDMIDKIMKLGIVDYAIQLSEFKDSVQLTKSDGKKTARITGIPKLEDANKAGTKESQNCTLILTEGDSAKTFAIAGLSVIGRDCYGVYPLKGKPLNVRDTSDKKVSENNEINDIKKIMGLQHGQTYLDTSALRYGSILILTDQDVDGSHIKGLLFNLFHTYWPTLVKLPGFLCSMATPIVKARMKKEVISFYTLSEYEAWKESEQAKGNWDIKYYKGLGTSTSLEAREYFKQIGTSKIQYVWKEEEDASEKALQLAFDKKCADDRKDWLKAYDPANILEMSQKEVPYDEFVHKDLIHFSNSDNKRSIPSVYDGLKPSQRKVLFGAFKRNLNKSIKVAQLSGYVSEHAAYHHGEMSLNQCIISMAQEYVGSNNIPHLVPEGGFGTRLNGGKDAASPRYIFTKKSPLLSYIFHPHDEPLLPKQIEEGQEIEPQFYVPIIPMILVNGAMGIGTGYSTQIPCFNPKDVVTNLMHMMENQPLDAMKPYFRGFTGLIEERYISGTMKMVSVGTYHWNKVESTGTKDQTLTVTELPIGYWTDDFKAHLEDLMNDVKQKKACVMWYKNDSTESKVHMTIKFTKDAYEEFVKNPELMESVLGLVNSSYTSMSNMHLYDSTGHIKKYDSIDEIFLEFYLLRLGYYIKRKEHDMEMLSREREWYRAKILFLDSFIEKKLELAHREDEQIEADMLALEIPKLPMDFLSEQKKTPSYEYLLSMEIRSLTKKKKEDLEKKLQKAILDWETLNAKSEKEIWKEDLHVFMEKYEAWQTKTMEDAYASLDDEEDEKAASSSATMKGKKKVVQLKKVAKKK